MGCLPYKADPKAFRRRLCKPGAIYDTPLRETTQVMKGVYLRDALFPDQLPANDRPAPGLLSRLEYKIYIRFGFFSVQFQSKSTQRRTMAVVPAFVGNACIPRVITQGVILRDRQGIHVRPERDLSSGILRLFDRIKPASTVNNPKTGILDQKAFEPLSGFPLLHG